MTDSNSKPTPTPSPTPPPGSEPSPNKKTGQDSFGFDIKKNPWLIYALAHIPIVVIMVVIVYVLYHARNGG